METDNNLILSHCCWIRLLVTSINVIHSWGIHSLGWKFDGIPGILNGIYYHLCFIGFFNGLCYELCGLLHNFMSIRIYLLSLYAALLLGYTIHFIYCIWGNFSIFYKMYRKPNSLSGKVPLWQACSYYVILTVCQVPLAALRDWPPSGHTPLQGPTGPPNRFAHGR